ncbi:putative methyltransferase-domain-containing protein [Pseudoneurospora amorphoporcata]|uniref:Methyltransferase-domain-containing protein n=1 Tax=Pseudoneurospora amorphoporcata TaxID=241081 RepID=A0AAN6NK50_9PEZI|nr:putative methyltransferase-domain-containing protein [Pseudoneurospora amorphoporcata]
MTVSVVPSPEELPHLWQRPAYATLLDVLQRLRQEPRIWGLKESREEILKAQAASMAEAAFNRQEIISFLSSIIKSGLPWLDNDEQREDIWEEASRRLAERCGRTAMGEIIRRWPFRDENIGDFDLAIREPPLTGDSLGLKTWGSSYVLAQLLPQFLAGPLAHLFVGDEPLDALELGSGTGLLGIAAACLWKANVALTDLPNIVPNLSHNAQLNRATVEAHGGKVEAAALTWGSDDYGEDSHPRFGQGNRYKLIIVADPLYDDNHPELLSSAIDAQLSLESDARLLVMVPQRDETTKGLTKSLRFKLEQARSPLTLIEDAMAAGEDDWGEGETDEAERVGFWWGIYRRENPS